MKQIKNKKNLIITSSLIIIFILIIAECIQSNYFLTVNEYSFNSKKITDDICIVYISDLHNKEFGENNSDLIKIISEQNPDFIAVGGDMVTRTYANDDVMKNLLTRITEIAPVYCCMGNHERDLSTSLDIKSDIENCGAILLDNEYTNFTTKSGENILIVGISDYPYAETEENEFWRKFKESEEYAKGNYTLLLHHQPEYTPSLLTDSKIDLALCGHTHGGLVQIPLLGGVIAPNQGLFPEYDKGVFEFGNSSMIVSSGLGVSNPVPRFNNPPEVSVIKLNAT